MKATGSLRDFLLRFEAAGGEVTRISYILVGGETRKVLRITRDECGVPREIWAGREDGSSFAITYDYQNHRRDIVLRRRCLENSGQIVLELSSRKKVRR